MKSSSNYFWLFSFLLIFFQIAFLYTAVSHGDVPFGEDQDAYLKGIDNAQKGDSYFDGQKNPLLSVGLSMVVPSGVDAFTSSRLWVMWVTVMLTVVQLYWSRRLWGDGAALLWAFFLAFNSTALDHGSMVMIEPWLLHITGFFLLSWCEAVRDPKHWYCVGGYLGFGLLAKGTIPILVVAVILALVLSRNMKACGRVLLTTFIVYLPFLIYRYVAFGDPFYQVSQGLSWLGFYHPHNLEGSSLGDFVAEQGVGGLFARLFSGLGQIPTLAVSAVGPLSSSLSFSFLILFALLFLSLWRSNKAKGIASSLWDLPRETKLLAIFWAGLWLLFCAWMVPVAYVTRYFIPFVPLVGGVLVFFWRQSEVRPMIPTVFALMTLWFFPWGSVNAAYLKEADLSWKEDKRYLDYLTIRDVIEKDFKGDDQVKIFYGPGKTLPETWLWGFERITLSYGQHDNQEEVFSRLKEADYWVIDSQTQTRNGEVFEAFCQKLIAKYSGVDAVLEMNGLKASILLWLPDRDNTQIMVVRNRLN